MEGEEEKMKKVSCASAPRPSLRDSVKVVAVVMDVRTVVSEASGHKCSLRHDGERAE